MAASKISQLQLSTITSDDFVPISRTGANYRLDLEASIDSVLSGRHAGNINIGGNLEAAGTILASSDIATNSSAFVGDYIYLGTNSPGTDRFLYSRTGTPEGSVTAPTGSMYLRRDGGTNSTLYVKASGVSNTGWEAVLTSISQIYTGRSFGIIPDGGAADQTSLFNAAINSIYSAGGGTLLLEPGTYKCNESAGLAILLKTGVKLKGAGMDKTIITTDNTIAASTYCLIAPYAYNTISNAPYSAHDLDIEDLSLTCESYANTTVVISSATYNSGTETLLNVGTAGGLVAGMQVSISSVTNIPNGTYTITSVVSATSFAINLTWSGSAATQSGSVVATVPQRLHNLIGIVNNARTRITRVSFYQCPFHAAEFNWCKNVILKDCATGGSGNFNGAIFELDPGGSAGQLSTSAYYSTSYTAGSVYGSPGNTQTLLTVTSTTNFRVGDHVVLTGGYSEAGGFKITEIVSSTTMAIDRTYTSSSSGTVKATIPITDITIDGFNQSVGRSDAGIYSAAYMSYEFMYLSHTSQVGIYRNIRITNCLITPHTTSVPMIGGATVACLAFDSGAYPLEFTGLEISNTHFKGGGITSVTTFLALEMSPSTTYNRKLSRVVIRNNIFEGGMYNALRWGRIYSYDQPRIAITEAELVLCSDILIENNLFLPRPRGNTVLAARASRVLVIGAGGKAIIRNNRIVFDNSRPDNLNGLGWSTSAGNYGMLIEHPKDLILEGNDVEVLTTEDSYSPGISAFVLGCSAFELPASGPIDACWIIENNSVFGVGPSGVGLAGNNNLSAPFLELISAGVTDVAYWANPANPSVKGRWKGNRVVASGTLSQTLSPSYLPIPISSITTTATTEATAATRGGHSNWWSEVESVQTMGNANVTILPNTTLLMITGSFSGARTGTLPYATRSSKVKIIDAIGTLTGSNTLVLSRAGTDTITGGTSNVMNTAYSTRELISDKISRWTIF